MILTRYMTEADFPRVLRIERASFNCPWPESLFRHSLRERSTVAVVAYDDIEAMPFTVGYVFYKIGQFIEITNLAVAPVFRRQRVGSTMVTRLITKFVDRPGKQGIRVQVRETNLAAQMFLRSLGFRAISTFSNFYSDSDEDSYLMELLFRH